MEAGGGAWGKSESSEWRVAERGGTRQSKGMAWGERSKGGVLGKGQNEARALGGGEEWGQGLGAEGSGAPLGKRKTQRL